MHGWSPTEVLVVPMASDIEVLRPESAACTDGPEFCVTDPQIDQHAVLQALDGMFLTLHTAQQQAQQQQVVATDN